MVKMLSARIEQCAAERCPLHLARQRAEQAHLVIVNHALLLADVANENHVLPAFMDLIIDEAHHLESAVTNGLSFRADKRFLETVLEEFQSHAADCWLMYRRDWAMLFRSMSATSWMHLPDEMRQEAKLRLYDLMSFLRRLTFSCAIIVQARSQFAQQIRVTMAVRTQPGYDEIEISWENLHTHLKAIGKDFDKLARRWLILQSIMMSRMRRRCGRRC